MSSYSAMKTMKFALDRFDYALPGTTPGSEPWQEAMETLRSKYESAKETERSDFFDTLSALEPKEEEHKKPGA